MLVNFRTVFNHRYTRLTFNFIIPLIIVGSFVFVWATFFPPNQGFWKQPFAEISKWGGEQTLKITDVEVSGASEILDTQISLYLTEELRKINLDSLNLDLNKIKQGIDFIPSVSKVELAIEKNGVLKVVVEERVPRILWYENEQYHLLDKNGMALDSVTNRNAYADLFVIAGEAVDTKVEEALKILNVSDMINHQIRGLIWVGGRRWDIVLDKERLIKLPEQEPIEAMRKIKILDEEEDLLSRDISIIDLRIPDKIYIRYFKNNNTEEE